MDALVQKRGAPEINCTPKYYAANKNIEIWFRLRSIEKVTPELFSSRFGDAPASEHTFFPVSRDIAHPKQALPDYARLASDYVVHLSDLHFGRGIMDSLEEKEVGKRIGNCSDKQDINDVCKGAPGLIVVSGDLTTKGDANALQVEGLNFLYALHVELKVPKEATSVIPGNHDFPFDGL